MPAPAINARQRYGLDDVVVHAGGVAPRRNVAALVQNPPPRHEAEFAQPHGRVADVLRGRAGALVAASDAVDFRHNAALSLCIPIRTTSSDTPPRAARNSCANR